MNRCLLKPNCLKNLLLLNKRHLRILSSTTTTTTPISNINHEIFQHKLKEFIGTNATILNFIKFQIKIDRQENNKKESEKVSSDQDEKKNDKNEEEDSSKNDPNDPNEAAKKLVWLLFSTAIVYITLYGIIVESTGNNEEVPFISWQEFVSDMLAAGEVEEIVVNKDAEAAAIKIYNDAVVRGKKPKSHVFQMKITPDFEERLRKAEDDLRIRSDKRVNIRYVQSDLPIILTVILALIIAKFLFNITTKTFQNPMNLMSQITKANFTKVDPAFKGSAPKVKFADVAGLKEAKIEIMEFVEYLKHPARFQALGAKVPKGALLLGPPGCGKTLLAKALANESGVPFYSMAGTEFIEIIGGVGAARVRDLFTEARKNAPAIIYIDEIDTIGRQRSDGSSAMGNTEMDQTLNQLLSEMDGLETKINSIIVLASTNRAEVLDKALLRPGRFDRHVTIDLPTHEERKEILSVHMKRLKMASNVDEAFISELASMTPRMSGADLANICNEAALSAAREAHTIIAPKDFEQALEKVLSGPEKKNSTILKDEQQLIAYHESGHVLLSWLLKNSDQLLKVSLVQRTKALSFTRYLPSELMLYTKEELIDKMCLHFGGRVAESLVSNAYSTHCENDLKRITKIAYAIVKSYGMSDHIGQLSFPSEDEQRQQGFMGSKPYSKRLQNQMDQEAFKIINQARDTAESLIKNNMDKLHLIAKELVARETLTYDDIERLIGRPVHEHKLKKSKATDVI